MSQKIPIEQFFLQSTTESCYLKFATRTEGSLGVLGSCSSRKSAGSRDAKHACMTELKPFLPSDTADVMTSRSCNLLADASSRDRLSEVASTRA